MGDVLYRLVERVGVDPDVVRPVVAPEEELSRAVVVNAGVGAVYRHRSRAVCIVNVSLRGDLLGNLRGVGTVEVVCFADVERSACVHHPHDVCGEVADLPTPGERRAVTGQRHEVGDGRGRGRIPPCQLGVRPVLLRGVGNRCVPGVTPRIPSGSRDGC